MGYFVVFVVALLIGVIFAKPIKQVINNALKD